MADSNHGLRNDVVGEPELAIEFKSSRRNHHGARVLAGSICFRNNAEAHAASHKTQGQVQAGWSRAHDQYRSSHYTLRTKLPNHRSISSSQDRSTQTWPKGSHKLAGFHDDRAARPAINHYPP